jgi:hypothetical protein
MAATLGGVTIASSIVWTDKFQYSGIAQQTTRTLGGRLVVYRSALTGGRPITLESLEDQGCVPLAVVAQLQALSAALGAVYTLEIGGESYQVSFRHEEPPAFSATPAVISRSVPLEGDLFRVSIKLYTV